MFNYINVLYIVVYLIKNIIYKKSTSVFYLYWIFWLRIFSVLNRIRIHCRTRIMLLWFELSMTMASPSFTLVLQEARLVLFQQPR